jgi:hypothetical protein
MPLSLVLDLPLELRTQIYSYLFTTPKSRIELVKTSSRGVSHLGTRHKILPLNEDGGEEIRLSFLRTCKQIYAETKHLLWQHNTLHLESILYPVREGIIDPVVMTGFKHHVQSVQLDIDLIFDKSLSGRLIFGHNLSMLATWATEGHLSSITLTARSMMGSNNLTHRQLERILIHRRHPNHGLIYRDYLKDLELGTSIRSSLSTIKRRLVIDTGAPMLEAATWRPRQPIRSRCGNPMDMLSEVATAWGGRLEVNGVLAYEDGKPVDEDIFFEQVEPHQYYYADDVHLWLMTEVVKELVDGKHIGEVLLSMDRKSRAAYYRKLEPQLLALKEAYGIRRIAADPSVEHPEPGMASAYNH